MISEQDVADYLDAHPDFLERHPHLLERLEVPHGAAGGAVSLVEKQVKVLRERQSENRERLAELVLVARANESLAANVHKLTLRLLHCNDAAQVVQAVEHSMRDDFGVPQARFVQAGELPETMRSMLGHDRARCGQLGEPQRAFLFPTGAASIASMALIPIGSGSARGMLALGSPDPARFHPGISTEFLERIGDMINAALGRYGVEPAV